MGTMVPTSQARYVSEKVVAEMTGIPVSTLQKHRHYRKGIPYSKLGKLIRYDLQDVVDYMVACRINPEQ